MNGNIKVLRLSENDFKVTFDSPQGETFINLLESSVEIGQSILITGVSIDAKICIKCGEDFNGMKDYCGKCASKSWESLSLYEKVEWLKENK